MTTLSDLVKKAKGERGVRSGLALTKLAQEHGHNVDRTTINSLLAGTYKYRPSRTLLEAIAWLAQVELAVVYGADELPMPGPSFADELPPEVDRLEPHQRRVVIEVIRGFLADVQEVAGLRTALGSAVAGDPSDLSAEARELAEQVGGMSVEEVEIFISAGPVFVDEGRGGFQAVLDHRAAQLPTLAEGRNERRRRLREAAQLQDEAAYTDDDSDGAG